MSIPLHSVTPKLPRYSISLSLKLKLNDFTYSRKTKKTEIKPRNAMMKFVNSLSCHSLHLVKEQDSFFHLHFKYSSCV